MNHHGVEQLLDHCRKEGLLKYEKGAAGSDSLTDPAVSGEGRVIGATFL